MTKATEATTPTSQDLYTNSKKDFKPNKFEDFGYFFYPERLGNVYKPAWYEKLVATTGTTDAVNKLTCEKNVQKAIENHPGVKLLLKAMKDIGCETNLLRHFSCEQCDGYVKGGFDPATNQVIVCYNTVNKLNDDVEKSMVSSLLEAYDYCRANYNANDLSHLACSKIVLCSNRVHEYDDCVEILSHELVHAFDVCRAYVDTANNYHVACTEECVRAKAALSLQTVRNISEEEALKAVDSVFDRCYNDLEPFGRRVYNREDCERAYKDRYRFGYKD